MTAPRPSRRRSARFDPRRVLVLGLVGCALAGLLVAGAELRGSATAAYAGRSGTGSLIPVLHRAGSAATVWNCPGPLQVSGGAKPSILLENPSSVASRARLVVAETAVGGGRGEQLLRGRSLSLTVAPHSSTRYVLSPTAARRRGGRGAARGVVIEAAVSVTAAGAPLAAVEQLPTAAGVLESPCAPGSAADGYAATGVTTGSSSLDVALFDPTAAPAVVNVAVGTGNGPEQPPTYEGVSLSPGSLFVLHIARYVPLREQVAVAVHATVGRFVLGAISLVNARFVTSRVGPGHSYLETGEALLSGVGRPLRHFVMPYGAAGASDAEAVRLFDPGTRPATVSLAADSGRLSVTVLPGHTFSAGLPLPTRHVAGAVTISSNVGIAAEQETYVTTSVGHVQLVSSPLLAAGSDRFVIPAGGGVVQRGVVVLAATGGHQVTVELDRAPAPGRGAVLLGRRILRPGRETVIPLGRGAVGTLEVLGDGPFAAGGFLVSATGGRSLLPVIPFGGS